MGCLTPFPPPAWNRSSSASVLFELAQLCANGVSYTLPTPCLEQIQFSISSFWTSPIMCWWGVLHPSHPLPGTDPVQHHILKQPQLCADGVFYILPTPCLKQIQFSSASHLLEPAPVISHWSVSHPSHATPGKRSSSASHLVELAPILC